MSAYLPGFPAFSFLFDAEYTTLGPRAFNEPASRFRVNNNQGVADLRAPRQARTERYHIPKREFLTGRRRADRSGKAEDEKADLVDSAILG